MTKTIPTKLRETELGGRFYTLGDHEPNGPFIYERDRFLTYRHYGRRPESNDRTKFFPTDKVYLSWSDACNRLAEDREERAETLLREAVALRLKAEEK